LTALRRPVPVPDEQSEPFWRAAAAHVLSVARCARCDQFSHPPDVVCPRCGATDPAFVFTPVDGSGTIRSWTIMRQSFLPGFDRDVPFVLVDGPNATLRVGAPVRLTFEDIDDGVAIPAWALEQSN